MAYRSKTFNVITHAAILFTVFALNGCGSSSSAQNGASTADSTTAPAGASASDPATTTGTTPPTTTPPTTTPPTSAPPTTPASPTAGTGSGGSGTAAAAPPASAATGPVTASNNADACLAAPMPSASTLFNSTKRTFAHYITTFPASIDNKPSASDYYNVQYLSKSGESNKWAKQGGFLRQRPLGVPTSTSSNWRQIDMEGEVRAAMARGITGFTFDVLAVSDATSSTGPLHTMLAAAAAVDSRFKIVVMPDLTQLGANSDAVVQIITSIASNPAAYHLSDGRLVVSAFNAGQNSAAWWQGVLSRVAADGIQVAFVPTFVSWPATPSAWQFSYGLANWGSATPSGAIGMQGNAEMVHNTLNRIFMAPVDPQQYRAKDFVFWEPSNSVSFRDGWTSAIQGDSDWVQLVTWNDFSESSSVQPYTDATLNRGIGTGYYNLMGYYASWFLTGQQPKITHDVLYYFYRREPTNAAGPDQSKLNAIVTGSAENNIELLAFLTSPGVLKITIGGKTVTQNAAAGLVSFKTPIAAGTPVFTLTRNGVDVFSVKGSVQIYGSTGLPSGIQDLTYWSGSGSQTGNCIL
jgi:hypothetical protein